MTIIAGIASIALLIYLIVALLKGMSQTLLKLQ